MTLALQPFKHLKANRDRVSASEYNRLVDLVGKMARSLFTQGLMDSTGFSTRRSVAPPSTDIRLFEVQSAATGDGLYTCWEQNLDATDWADEGGVSKIAKKLPEVEVTVLNLAEYDPEATYIAVLEAGDLLAAWQKTDDDGTKRWIGVPFHIKTEAGIVRRAKVTVVGATTLTCYLKDGDGDDIETNITVSPIEHLGSNALTGDVWPDLAANDIISIFKDLNGTWYTTFVFDDSTDCT